MEGQFATLITQGAVGGTHYQIITTFSKNISTIFVKFTSHVFISPHGKTALTFYQSCARPGKIEKGLRAVFGHLSLTWLLLQWTSRLLLQPKLGQQSEGAARTGLSEFSSNTIDTLDSSIGDLVLSQSVTDSLRTLLIDIQKTILLTSDFLETCDL